MTLPAIKHQSAGEIGTSEDQFKVPAGCAGIRDSMTAGSKDRESNSRDLTETDEGMDCFAEYDGLMITNIV